MKIDFIPFQIGMQYENWEFDLDPIDSFSNYVKYELVKKDSIRLFKHRLNRIVLYFNLDILFGVEMFIDSTNPLQSFSDLAKILVKELGNKELVINENLTIITLTWKDQKKSLILEYSFKLNQVILILVENKYNEIF